MITPLNIGVAGQVAADGTFSFTQPRIAIAQPAVILVTLQTIGSPAWTLTVAGRPASFAPGNSVDLGPRLVAPNESVTVSFTGGVPNAQVTGQIHGARADSVDEVIQYGGLLSANMVSLNSLINRQKLYPDGTPPSQQGLKFPSFSCPVATPTTGTFTLPPNTTNVRISILTSPPNSPFSTRFQVVGHVNQIPYSPSVAVDAGLPITTINGFRPIDIRVEPSAEPQVDITVNGDSSHILSVFVSAMYGAETTSIAGITSENGIPVTFNTSGVTPAPWQAAATMIAGKFAAAAGTDFALVSGGAGQNIWVFDLGITHNGNVAYEGSLWDGASALGVQRGELRMPAADTPPAHIVGAGAKAVATAGNSLIWRPDAEQVGTTTYFTLAYTQA